MKKKVVALIVPSIRTLGGTETMVLNLARLFYELGLTVKIISFDSPGSGKNIDSPVELVCLGSRGEAYKALRPLTYLDQVFKLMKTKKDLGVCLSISNLWRADLVNFLTFTQDKKLSVCHINIIGNESNKLMLRFVWFVRWVYKSLDYVVAVSESLLIELRRLYQLEEVKSRAIENFTFNKTQDLIPKYNLSISRFVWCGRLAREKNLKPLLVIWKNFIKKYPQSQLVLMGEGSERESLEDFAKQHGLKCSGNFSAGEGINLIFSGRVENPSSYFNQFSALLLPSLSEGLPLALLEAVASGLPVIASNCPSGGVADALRGYGEEVIDSNSIAVVNGGILLPIPHVDDHKSIKLWCDALEYPLTKQHIQRWKESLPTVAQRFSSFEAKRQWSEVFQDLGIK